MLQYEYKLNRIYSTYNITILNWQKYLRFNTTVKKVNDHIIILKEKSSQFSFSFIRGY
jgi:hypothetical protein